MRYIFKLTDKPRTIDIDAIDDDDARSQLVERVMDDYPDFIKLEEVVKGKPSIDITEEIQILQQQMSE